LPGKITEKKSTFINLAPPKRKPVNEFYTLTYNLFTSRGMAKPKGGRGKKAPYQTKQMRVSVPVELQVIQLSERYREFIEAGGDPEEPPPMLESPNRSQQETSPSMLEWSEGLLCW
jgi:hypothetical protein